MSAVPAWKRLGLKLKGASSDGSPAATTSQPTTETTSAPPPGRFAHHQQRSNFNADRQYGTPTFNKRKQFPSGSYSASDNKRPRWDDSGFTPSKKSVSFSQDTKKAAPKKPKPAKKKNKAPKRQPAPQPHDLTPSLEYLRTWHKARDAWKFNKNHQTLLLKYMYEAEALPAADIDSFYLYISDIKGGSRTRLIEQAEGIRKKDMEAGPKGFPEGTKSPEEIQGQYEGILADLLKKTEAKEGESSNGAPKRSFDEVEFTLRTVDKDIRQRLVKRMRAELVIDTLRSSNSGDDAGPPSVSTVNATSSKVRVPVQNGADTKANAVNATKQKTKRRKKLRTADTDSSSSDSESSSQSDSDSSSDDSDAEVDNPNDSSSSSSESDLDEESGVPNGRANSETSTSSSSSSSESESGDASSADTASAEDDDTSGSDGDSESSGSNHED
jgi:hypothetical protein